MPPPHGGLAELALSECMSMIDGLALLGKKGGEDMQIPSKVPLPHAGVQARSRLVESLDHSRIQLCWGLSMVGTVKSCPLTELSIEAFNMAVPLVPVIHVSPRPLTVGLTESTNGLCWEVAVLFAGKWPCFLLGSGRG